MRTTEPAAPVTAAALRHLRWRLRLELFWRARLLPLHLPRDLPFERMLALATPPEGAPLRGLPAPEIAARVHRALQRPILMRDRRCLREGVLCFRFLRAAGFDPRLHFGVDPSLVQGRRFSAHCWVTLEGTILAGDIGVPMVALHVFPDDRARSAGRAPGQRQAGDGLAAAQRLDGVPL